MSISVADLATGNIIDVRSEAGDAQFVAPDWVLFREGVFGSLYAQRLDLQSLRLIGEPTALLERVVGVRTLPSYAASSNVLVALQKNAGEVEAELTNDIAIRFTHEPETLADVKPGLTILANPNRNAEGKLTSGFNQIEKNGHKPIDLD